MIAVAELTHDQINAEREALKLEQKHYLRGQRELAAIAPNPRDYATWDAFYAAQAAHDADAALYAAAIAGITARGLELSGELMRRKAAAVA